MTNAELLSLIGEIDGITLRSVGKYGVGVFLEIGDEEFELITDSGDNIAHHITRIGIAERLEYGNRRKMRPWDGPDPIEHAETETTHGRGSGG